MLAKCLIYDFTFTFSFFFFICSTVPGAPFSFICNICMPKKWWTRLKFPSDIFGCGENERQSYEIIYDISPIALAAYNASALIKGLNRERQMKFQMKVIESIKFKPPIQMAVTQNPTLLRLSVWVSKKSLPTSIIHNPIPRSKCHCLFDMYCVFAKYNHQVFPR